MYIPHTKLDIFRGPAAAAAVPTCKKYEENIQSKMWVLWVLVKEGYLLVVASPP